MKVRPRLGRVLVVAGASAAVLVSAVTTAAAVSRVRLKGYCTAVLEADLLEVWLGPHDELVQVKLVGIDRASMEEAYPRYATLLTRSYALDRPVTVEVVEKAADGLITGRVIVDHEDLSYRLIAEGLARFDGSAPPSLRLHLAEEASREAGRGLWAPDDDEELARQQEAARELRLGDIAWQLDARRAAEAATSSASGEEVVTEVAVGPGAEETERLEMHLGSWVGAHTSLVTAHWGEPSWVDPGEDGGWVLVYERCGPVAAGDGGCRVRFFANADGIIVRRVWESG